MAKKPVKLPSKKSIKGEAKREGESFKFELAEKRKGDPADKKKSKKK